MQLLQRFKKNLLSVRTEWEKKEQHVIYNQQMLPS